MRNPASNKKAAFVAVVAAVTMLIATAALAAPGEPDDTLISFGYDTENHVLVASVSGTDTPYDCTLNATYRTQYGAAIEAITPVDMLTDENLDPVEFGNRSLDLVGDDYTPAEAPIGYSGADGICGLNAVAVGGAAGQVNHGQMMKAFHALVDMKGRGCLNRIIAQSNLGKGDQQIKTSDVDPLFEVSDKGIVEFTSATAACDHGNEKGDDHPSNRDKKSKPEKNNEKSNRGRNK